MSKVINVLVFPAGEVNSVELHDALSTCVNVKLYGGSSVDRHGPYIFQNYIGGLPFIDDDNFIEIFNAVLKEHCIDVIFPTHDAVAVFLAENKDRIKAKLTIADVQTARTCRDKQKTHDLFKDCSFTPKVFDDDLRQATYPLFIRPKQGAGSVGAKKIDNYNGLTSIKDHDQFIVTEYLPGEEYTVDCLTDKNGELKLVSPRSRNRTLAGISVAGQTVETTNDIQAIADTINQRLKFTGLWFFQVKKNVQGKPKLLEVCARSAGTMCLTRARGVNLPLLSVYVVLGYDIDVILNDYHVKVDRSLISRYRIDYDYDTVYFDFDDTLVINGRVHPYSIMFLYQCKNVGKDVYLITRHAHNIRATLNKYAIDEGLFKDIVHLDEATEKISKINPSRAIFIDNAFQERKFVHDRFKIPVFDVDGLEVLLDWRS